MDRSSAVSTSALFAADNRQGWQVIRSANAGIIETLNLPVIAHKAIEDDLDGNFLVVLRPASNDGMTAWWRIHRQSGQSLGMLASENWLGGGTVTDSVILTRTIAVVVLAVALTIVRIMMGDSWKKWFDVADERLDEVEKNLDYPDAY